MRGPRVAASGAFVVLASTSTCNLEYPPDCHDVEVQTSRIVKARVTADGLIDDPSGPRPCVDYCAPPGAPGSTPDYDHISQCKMLTLDDGDVDAGRSAVTQVTCYWEGKECSRNTIGGRSDCNNNGCAYQTGCAPHR